MAENKKMTFESAMERLEQIAQLLERGDAPIEESLSLYEEGAKLLKYCSGVLEKAEQKVSLITRDMAGEPEETPFDE